VLPSDDAGRLFDQRQSFRKVDQLFQSFFYVFFSGTFRY